MYAALNENGILTYAQDAVENQEYFCSQCSKPVKLIVTNARNFFRHENKKYNNINERSIHRQGKTLVATTLNKYLNVEIETEHFLPELQQRPDIWVNQHIAIEYQCAKIDVQTLSDRVKGYRQAGIPNLWILGGDYLSPRVKREHLKFINYSGDLGYYLLMLDSQSRKFIFFYQIEFIGPFSQIVFQRKTYMYQDFEQIFKFQPFKKIIKPIKMNGYLARKLRGKNDFLSQKLKLNFYEQHQVTIEDSLRNQSFVAQPPIYLYPAWQIICGQPKTLLNQPLLASYRLKEV